ncbi:hypothetical protein F4604DRAFT_1675357 [Suillus subluteus]|nr:hypothetical protein F4604DRAFT_1675357 [Suillus subluteus]
MPLHRTAALGTQTSFQSKGDHTLKSSADNMGTDGDCELELESEAKPKRKKKENLLLCKAVSVARLKKQNLDRPDDLIKVDQPGRSIDVKAHGLDKKGKNIESKKFSLLEQVNNWRDQVEPHPKGKSSKATSASGRSGTSIPCSTTDSRRSTNVTSATTFSQATEPPSTPPKTSKSVPKVTCSNDDNDNDNNNDESDSEERAAIIAEKGKGKAAMKTVIKIDSGTDTELHTAPIVGKNRTATSAKLTTLSLQESDADDDTVLSLPLSGTPFADLPYDRQLEIVSFALEQAPRISKRKIEEIAGELGLQVDDNLIDYEDGDDVMELGDDTMEFRDDTMELDSETKDASPIAKKVLKGTNSMGRITTAISITAVEKPLVLRPAKKARSEPATTQTLMTTTKVKSEPTSITSTTAAVPDVVKPMLADMAIKPAAGNGQWQFIPTVLLWAGSQSSFWTIEAADFLCAVQAIFNTMYPGVKYNIQPRGPIMGVASLRESEDADEEEDRNENADSKEQFVIQMAASLLEGYAFLFMDPDTCKASEIYCSVFMLQMIAMTHLNAVAGFVDVPELDTRWNVIGACAVALEHALKLVAEKEKKSANLKTPLKINKSTGKESSTPLAFSELNWGQFTTDYHLSIVKCGPKYMTDTIAIARQFVKDLGSDASTKGSLADDSVASSREYLFYVF